MWQEPEHGQYVDQIYLAGEKVRPGVYKQIGGTRIIRLEREDILPASLDGKVACYRKVEKTWASLNG